LERQAKRQQDSESIVKIILRKYLAYIAILAFAVMVMAVPGVSHQRESTYRLYICHAEKDAVSIKNLPRADSFSLISGSAQELFYLNFSEFIPTGKIVQFESIPLLSNSCRAPPSIF